MTFYDFLQKWIKLIPSSQRQEFEHDFLTTISGRANLLHDYIKIKKDLLLHIHKNDWQDDLG